VEQAWEIYESADILLVVGSSLAVYSGYRFVIRAVREGRPVAIVNLGSTRGDDHAQVRIEGRLGEVLPLLARELEARVHTSA
jgi:NAD-dependent SIR2 family protein deacetylase